MMMKSTTSNATMMEEIVVLQIWTQQGVISVTALEEVRIWKTSLIKLFLGFVENFAYHHCTRYVHDRDVGMFSNLVNSNKFYPI